MTLGVALDYNPALRKLEPEALVSSRPALATYTHKEKGKVIMQGDKGK